MKAAAIVIVGVCFVAATCAALQLAYDTGRRNLGAEISYVCAP